ncbi:MAG: hypothetical protein QM705_09075 [Ancrocorticia sp.]
MIYGTTQWGRALSALVLFVVLIFSLTTTASFASVSSPVTLGRAAAVSSNVKGDSSARGAIQGGDESAGAGRASGEPKTNAGSGRASGEPKTNAGSGRASGEPKTNAGSGRASGEPLVVIGFSGVLWKNVTPELMPNLYRFVGDAAGANIVVRTVGETTCPNEGWLTVGAGQRATDAVRDCRAQEAPVLAGDAAPAGDGAGAGDVGSDEAGAGDGAGAGAGAGQGPGTGASGAVVGSDGLYAGSDGSYEVSQWQTYQQSNRSSSFKARIGLLGSQLEGKSLAAIGPGAALALANSEGIFQGAYADVPALPGSIVGTAAGNVDPGVAAAGNAYAEIAAGRDLVMVDLGSVRYPNAQLTLDASGASKRGSDSAFEMFLAAFRAAGAAPPEVEPQLAALDARLGAVLEAIEGARGAEAPRIMVMSVGDSQNSVPQLGFFATRDAGPMGSDGLGGSGTADAAEQSSRGVNATGNEGDGADAVVVEEDAEAKGGAQLATSDATRQWGLVQLTDLFPTILESVHPDSSALVSSVGSAIRDRGEPFEDGQTDQLADRLTDDQMRSEIVRPLIGPFYVLVFVVFGVVAIVGWRVVRREPGGETPRWLPMAAAWGASLPVASLLVNLLPWWRASVPSVALFAGSAGIAVVIAALGLLTPIRSAMSGPATVIGGITALTLLLDILLDAFTLSFPLQVASLVGTQPQVGGRFYGLSNATFAMMTAGLLLMVACEAVVLARSGRVRVAAGFVATVGVLTVLIDGSAMLGADFGGPPALVVGFTLLTLLVCGTRLTPLRLFGVLTAAMATSFVFAIADYMKPPQQRSHLGRFIQTLFDGGTFEIVTRKLSQAFFRLPWWLVVILLVVALVVGLRWWKAHEAKPHSEAHAEARTTAGVAWQNSETLRYTVISVGAALVLGMIMNDSGIVVPALGAVIAGPLWLIMVLRHNQPTRRAKRHNASSR